MKIEFDTSALDKALGEMEEKLNQLEKKTIEVGVLSNDSELQMIANVHEYGASIRVTPKMRAWFAYNGYPLKVTTTTIEIPERSFMRTGRKLYEKDIANKTKKLMPDVLQGGVPVSLFMEMIGEEYAGKIQKNLRDLSSPANSPMTVENKGSSNPLIDTGRLMGAIKSEVK